MGSYDGLVVWITGGGSGIGRALALELAQQGAKVAVSGRRVDRLQEVVEELAATGRPALAVACDVADEASCKAAVATILEAFGQLDVAIANAGFGVAGKVEEMPDEAWRRQFDVNVFGVLNTVRAAMPSLRARQGRMVLVSSVAAFVYPRKNAAYSASKAAVRAIGEALSAELGSSGTTCTTVYPGFVESEIGQVDNQGVFHPEKKDPRPQTFMWTAEAAARAIAKGVLARRRELVITGHGKVIVALSRWLPWLTAWAGKRT